MSCGVDSSYRVRDGRDWGTPLAPMRTPSYINLHIYMLLRMLYLWRQRSQSSR